MRKLLLMCLLLLPVLAVADVTADLALVTRQFCESQLPAGGTTPKVDGFLSALREDGSWPDIDYNSKQWATWPTGNHLSRIQQMVVAWRRGDKTPGLTDGIHRALGYWMQHDFQCPNWWYNQIGGPQIMFTLALLLGDELHPDEYTYITQTMLPRTKIGMTGQNRVWLAGNTLMGALLRRDPATVHEAAQVIFSEIVVTTKEGIQPDFSFHQHGPQQQFGNYGLGFASEVTKWGEILRGSAWALPTDKLEVFRHYLLDGQRWVVWRGAMDISSCGRQLAANSPEGKSASLMRSMAAMARMDPAHAGEYTATLNRNVRNGVNDFLGARFFWRSDYLVHRRAEFMATVKMCSQRVIGEESLNSENLSGYYLADGACYLYRTGDEYHDIFPVWNWWRIPGVTCVQGSGRVPRFSNNRMKSAFVGGAADGDNSAAAMDYQRDGVYAKKAYFFAGDAIACLGAGIHADATVTMPIATSVNQCRLRGPVRLNDGTTTRTATADLGDLNTVRWVEHDGVRYVFPQAQQVHGTAGKQTGEWRVVRDTLGNPPGEQAMDIFSLWLDHGTNPNNAGYVYYIEPTEAARHTEITVLANSEQMQAVHVGANLLEAVFYTPGTLDYANTHHITVSAPCVLLLDSAAKHLAVADPTHTLPAVTITLDGTAQTITLPQGGDAGKTQVVDLK